MDTAAHRTGGGRVHTAKRAQALGCGGSQGEELGPLAWQRPPVEPVRGKRQVSVHIGAAADSGQGEVTFVAG